MKIVIDIPEILYTKIQNGKADKRTLETVILHGTPLPEGHGRLIDADVLKKDDELTLWLSLNPIRTGQMLKRFSELFIKKIDATETIIEAESEEEA